MSSKSTWAVIPATPSNLSGPQLLTYSGNHNTHLTGTSRAEEWIVRQALRMSLFTNLHIYPKPTL